MTADEAAAPTRAEDGFERLVERAVDRTRGDDGPNHPDTERHAATLDERARDALLLRRGRRVDVADERAQLLLRALGPVDESEQADDQREQRDGREEQLERDGAREERTFVRRERGGDGSAVTEERPDRCQDAASLFGAGLSGDFVSVFLSAFVSDLDSVFVSLLASPFLSAAAAPSSDAFDAGRLSVLYHPDPLNTIAGVDRRRRGCFPQLGHFWSASSLNDCTAENTWPQ
jgi:hypothetical protein